MAAKAGTILMSGMDVARAAYEAGFRGDALTTAVAIAKAESSWYRDVISATNDYGLWQINAPSHPSYNTQQLLDDAVYNARAAFAISGQGKNWNPWYTYKPPGGLAGTGPYRAHLSIAASSVNNFLNWGGATAGPGGGTVAPSPGTTAPGNVAPMMPISSVTPAPPPTWKPAVIDYKTAYRQQAFDKRMQAAPGMQRALKGAKIGPTHVGWIEPLNTKALGYEAPKGYGGHPVAVPGGNLSGVWKGTNGPVYTGTISVTGSNGGYVDISAPFLSVFFLFNPNKIQMNWQANPNLLPIGALDQTQVDPNLPMADPANTLSFQLYFDRTYEVCDGNKWGVYLDVRQLEQITGISPEQPVMRSYPVKIFFGKPSDFHINALITGMSVLYDHFSHEMVPMRATVDITASRLSSVHPFADKKTTEFYGAEDWRTKIITEGPPSVESMGPKK